MTHLLVLVPLNLIAIGLYMHARVKNDLFQKHRPLAKHLFRLQVRERWQDKMLYYPRFARGT